MPLTNKFKELDLSHWSQVTATNPNTRVCRKHFVVNAHKRCLRPDKFPMQNLPFLPTQYTRPTPRRVLICKPIHNDDDDDDLQVHLIKDVAVSTEPDEIRG